MIGVVLLVNLMLLPYLFSGSDKEIIELSFEHVPNVSGANAEFTFTVDARHPQDYVVELDGVPIAIGTTATDVLVGTEIQSPGTHRIDIYLPDSGHHIYAEVIVI